MDFDFGVPEIIRIGQEDQMESRRSLVIVIIVSFFLGYQSTVAHEGCLFGDEEHDGYFVKLQHVLDERVEHLARVDHLFLIRGQEVRVLDVLVWLE